MAVVQKLADAMPDLDAAKPGKAPVQQNHGVLRTSHHRATIANGDSAASTVEVARIPAHARVSKLSKIHSSGVAGVTNADLGFEGAGNALVSAASLAAAGTVDGASAITTANYDKKVWELKGDAKDPKAEIPVFLTLNTAATGAGEIVVELVYVDD